MKSQITFFTLGFLLLIGGDSQTAFGQAVDLVGEPAFFLDDDFAYQYYFIARYTHAGKIWVIMPGRQAHMAASVSDRGSETADVLGKRLTPLILLSGWTAAKSTRFGWTPKTGSLRLKFQVAGTKLKGNKSC